MFDAVDNNKLFNAGVYIRVNTVNNSDILQAEVVSHQKDFLADYVHRNGWNLVDVYCDNGYSGINFNRPDFKRMIGDVKKRRINMVVTMDVSRLGRNLIDIVYYLGRFFPKNQVRYIAVKNGIDTFDKRKNNNILTIADFIKL